MIMSDKRVYSVMKTIRKRERRRNNPFMALHQNSYIVREKVLIFHYLQLSISGNFAFNAAQKAGFHWYVNRRENAYRFIL